MPLVWLGIHYDQVNLLTEYAHQTKSTYMTESI